MAACPRCGEENPERARFCLACGSELDAAIPLQVRKTVTVLFCDVTGSTSLGERQDPELIRGVMSRYYDEARAVLERHGGTVEKFIGDAVMAVFGIPTIHEDDALRALRAACELREAIDALNEELERSFGVRIDVRIGVNSGEVIAGDPSKRESFVAGDAVNVAQRLEASAGAGEILVGDATYRLARDAIEAEPLDPIAVKGRADEVVVHRLLAVVPGALSHARRFDSPMVGRRQELALLEDAFYRAVREQSCHLFTILGPAGVGKSRLVSEALRAIGVRATVCTGSCLPYGEGITFWPALEVVKQATGIVDGDSAAEAIGKIQAALTGDESAGLVAERVARLVGLDESGATAEQGFWGFRKLLETLARRHPLVVVFDDANWGEPTFLDLVEYVAEWTREAPVLLVCLARPELLDSRPTWGGGKHNATSIFLEPLSEDESAVLLGNLLSREVAGEVLARIHPSAEGNPLFVEEMVSMLIDGGYLHGDGGWSLAADPQEIAVPDSIQVLLASRLDQLSSGERRAIERAAVEGTVFHRGAVDALADAELAGRVDDCLAALVRKELIRPHRASFAGEDAFRFRHVLIREAAYDALPKQLRSELHERFAAWLEAVGGERIPELEELLGYHLEQSYLYRLEVTQADARARALARRAGTRLAAAGRRALAKGDTPAAVNLLERAAGLLSEDAPLRLTVLPDLGVALYDAGELIRAEGVLSEAAEAAGRTGDSGTAVRVMVDRANVLALSDPSATDEAFAEIDANMPVLEELGDDQALGVAWTLIGLQRGIWLGRFGDAERALERALEHATRSGDRRQQVEILRNLALAATWGPRSVPEAIARCEEILELAGGDRLVTAHTLRFLAVLAARLGKFDEARAHAATARAIYEDLGVAGHVLVSIAFALGEVELLAGNDAAAERELRAGIEVCDRIGERGHRSSLAAFLADALYRQGRLDEAEETASRAEEEAARDDIWTQSLARGTRAKVLARRGDAGAEPLAREAVALLEHTDGFNLRGAALLDLAEVLELEGRQPEAEEAATAAAGVFEREGNVVAVARARELVARAGRAVTAVEGRGDPAS